MKGPLRVTFCVLNLRMGGQVSNLRALAALLESRGVRVDFAVPEGLTAIRKSDLTGFARLPVWQRAWALLKMLRGLPDEPDHVVHLVVPGPSFAWVAPLASTSMRRQLLQSEGLPLSLDRAHGRVLRESPALLVPRLLLNNSVLARAFAWLPTNHLVTAEFARNRFKALGFDRVTMVPNFASMGPEDEGDMDPVLETFLSTGDPVIAYVGHAHAVKGVIDLVHAFPSALSNVPRLRLLLALSEDGSASAVEGALGELSEAARSRTLVVRLVPVKSLLRRIKALVLPYRHLVTTTLWPSLLLEADLLGCPLVLSSLPEFAEILDPKSKAIFRHAPEDPDDLAKALAAAALSEYRPDPGSLLSLPPATERLDQLLALYRSLA